MTRNESEEIVRLMRSIATHREQSDRYRLAWVNARNRARSYATDLEAHFDWSDDVQDERDGLRAEVVRLGQERDAARSHAVRLGLDTVVLRNMVKLLRSALDDKPFDEEGFDRLRAALDEERIEPEGANGHGKWCASLYAPPGQTYACDCNEVGAG